jgi:hypothetical protein
MIKRRRARPCHGIDKYELRPAPRQFSAVPELRICGKPVRFHSVAIETRRLTTTVCDHAANKKQKVPGCRTLRRRWGLSEHSESQTGSMFIIITELTEPPNAIRRRRATYHGSSKDPTVATENLHEIRITLRLELRNVRYATEAANVGRLTKSQELDGIACRGRLCFAAEVCCRGCCGLHLTMVSASCKRPTKGWNNVS